MEEISSQMMCVGRNCGVEGTKREARGRNAAHYAEATESATATASTSTAVHSMERNRRNGDGDGINRDITRGTASAHEREHIRCRIADSPFSILHNSAILRFHIVRFTIPYQRECIWRRGAWD